MFKNIKLERVPRMLLIGVLLLSLVVVLLWQRQTVPNTYRRNFMTIEVGDQVLEVVLAETPTQIQRGLSYRSDIGAEGMLFILPKEARPTFWMYEMQFPLDFVWIRGNEVVDIHTFIDPAKVTGGEIKEVRPDESVTHVLEVPAGWVEGKKIEPGARVRLSGDRYEKMW